MVWGDTQFGSGAGKDLVGQIFDPLGNSIGTQFQVNQAITANDEFSSSLAAMPDGGFVVAYDSFGGVGHEIGVDRYDSDGVLVVSRTITDGGSGPVTDPEVTVNADGDYIVAFDRRVGGEYTVHAIVYSGVTNDPGPEHLNTSQNGGDGEFVGAIDTFDNGDIISIYSELDGTGPFESSYITTEVRITSATGTPVTSHVELAGAEDHSALPQDIAVLADGRVVALYNYFDGDPTVAFQIGSVSGSSLTFDSEQTAASAGFPLGVVALEDGGFFIAWFASNTVLGTRYDANGAVVGTQGMEIAANASAASGDVSLTGDGRILVSYRNSNSDISQVILDPRESFITGTDGDDVMTSQTTTTFLFGQGGNDRLYGSGQQDFINGETGDDTVTGGGGDDTIHGNENSDDLFGDSGKDLIFGDASNDFLDGGVGNDTLDGGDGVDTLHGGLDNDTYVLATTHLIMTTFRYDTVFENAGDGIDTVRVQRTGFGNLVSYTLTANVENGVITGTDAFSLTGNGEANQLNGNGASNTLSGLTGADSIKGGGGTDVLNGNGGDDTLSGGGNKDTLNGGGGADIFDFRSVGDSTSTNYDTLVSADFAVDRFDTDEPVLAIDATISTGRLRNGAFDADLASAADAAHLGARHAVLFTPNSGNLAGKIFLIVDENATAGYQANQDLVIELTTPANLGGLDVTDFF